MLVLSFKMVKKKKKLLKNEIANVISNTIVIHILHAEMGFDRKKIREMSKGNFKQACENIHGL